MPNSQVCVDSNLVLKLVLLEEDSGDARTIWRDWTERRAERVAPPLLWYEVTSVLRTRVHRGMLTPGEAQEALDLILALDISPVIPPSLHQRAWDLANRLELPAAYDAHYLALAENLGCEFWTADLRLHRSVKDRLAWVRLLNETA